MKIISHIFIIAFLTILTQIGGIIWLLNFGIYKAYKSEKGKVVKMMSFILAYLISTFFFIPIVAAFFGRVPLPIVKSGNLAPHNYITPIFNRHYVKPRLKSELLDISNKINNSSNNLRVSYLDANFPFIDGFPLLPHLSHSDGRKIDLSFYYTKNNKEGNFKPSNTGYGKFVEPVKYEINQTKVCKARGYWQYDFTKFVTLGSRSDLEFDLGNTKKLLKEIVGKSSTQKILIEPHIENRLQLNNDKIRFHGCHAVRHDDHIHYQIK